MSRRTRVDPNDLRDELAIGVAQRLRCTSDDVLRVVSAVVDYLQAEYPAQDLYIAAPRRYPVDQIRAAIDEGRSLRFIERRFGIDRRTVLALLDAA